MRNLYIFLFLILLHSTTFQYKLNAQGIYLNLENQRSDSIDLLHTHLELELDISARYLSGYADVTLHPKIQALRYVPFDLLQYQVDSIVGPNGSLNFIYDDTLLTADMGMFYSMTDTIVLRIFYQGTPKNEGWGGFKFSGSFGYQVGAGFVAKPHNVGRYFYPCFDNFRERCTYSFGITVEAGNTVTCNGTEQSVQNLPGNKLRYEYSIGQTLPSYLVSVAAGPYHEILFKVNGHADSIPVELFSSNPNTIPMRNSFQNLEDAVRIYETYFGDYAFDRIGYYSAPGMSGAMEHAGNIAYMSTAIDGSTARETLMAHELSHHWWGNLATCLTPEDMWLNEGFASFCERLFLEHKYGWNRAKEDFETNKYDVLKNAHVAEGFHRPISGVPHEYTYGRHVYDKGAMVVQNLREFLGDSLFISTMTGFLQERRFDTMSSVGLQNYITQNTPLDASEFFPYWVFEGGFPDYVVDSIAVIPLGQDFEVQTFIQQKLNNAPDFYGKIPLEIAFVSATNDTVILKDTVEGRLTEWNHVLPFAPELTIVNPNERLQFATTVDQYKIDRNGGLSAGNTFLGYSISNFNGQAAQPLRIEHHWAAPDDYKTMPERAIRISDSRYWKVIGATDSMTVSAQGVLQGTANGAYLDSTILSYPADSIVLLYRTSSSDEWEEYSSYTLNHAGPGTKIALLSISDLIEGEYALGAYDAVLANPESIISSLKDHWDIIPNPAGDSFTIEHPNVQMVKHIVIIDMTGQELLKTSYQRGSLMRVSHIPPGNYVITLEFEDGTFSSKPFIIQ